MDLVASLGYPLKRKTRFTYWMDDDLLYHNTVCSNTFEYGRGDDRVTLYYQPVIYDGRYEPQNGINLYRNNSLAFSGLGSFYYTPDFLLKFNKDGRETYLVLDAKFCGRDYVRENLAASLVFKYLFSLSGRNGAEIEGLAVLYGMAPEESPQPLPRPESIYDRVDRMDRMGSPGSMDGLDQTGSAGLGEGMAGAETQSEIRPSFTLIPLIPGLEGQEEMLKALFSGREFRGGRDESQKTSEE